MENLEKVKLLARDLRDGKEFPRSPGETLGGYVLAARALDKCRSVLVGWGGEYHSNCPVDKQWLDFAEIDYEAFASLWPPARRTMKWRSGSQRSQAAACQDIIVWNNQLRDTRISDLPVETQVYMEDYIAKYIPRNRVVYRWFDVYDIEEERM